ncbi:MAG: CCA tRNA nucleotidyltransferase [Terracidiphilus sp.]|jgi:tRNA nucleotidyltransferase/poly(A) polymerase
MPDYIYLLENRLSADQQSALRQVREAAREAGTILFLTGDAVRDLTSGHAVRDLEFTLHGNALKLKKTMVKLGGKVWGEDEDSRTLYLCFPGTVRVDLVSAHRVEIPKPGKIIHVPASIQEDLRRRDFTVNAMALSLNEGSFGLLMDPMNGAADIEFRTLRLVSNYGFLEEPSLLIRATRYKARLGWEMDPKTQARYLNAREEGVIERLSAQARRRELEQIGHEEEGLKVLQALETEGWMKVLYPVWTSYKADEAGLNALHELAVELLMQGVHADMSAAQMRLLTARLSGREISALKKQMLRPGFVVEWSDLDSMAAGFAKVLLAKQNATPSNCFKLFMSYDPEAILWLGFTTKDTAIKERFNLFLKVWPELRQRIPYALMQELRITAELPAYGEIVQTVFLQLIDGKLATPEEARAFLEPYSPPAPPPQVTIKRPRVKRSSDVKLKGDSFDEESEEHLEEHLEEEEDLDDISGAEDDVLDLGLALPKIELDVDLTEESEASAGEDDEEVEEGTEKLVSKPNLLKGASKPLAKPKPEKAKKPQSAPSAKAQPKQESKPTSAKAAPTPARKPLQPGKPAAKKAQAKPTVKAKVLKKAKAASRPPAKTKAKASKSAPAKKKPVSAPSRKPVKAAKKAAPKSVKKRR